MAIATGAFAAVAAASAAASIFFAVAASTPTGLAGAA
jgi:hypothetical protein